jgi:hypothetical protein
VLSIRTTKPQGLKLFLQSWSILVNFYHNHTINSKGKRGNNRQRYRQTAFRQITFRQKNYRLQTFFSRQTSIWKHICFERKEKLKGMKLTQVFLHGVNFFKTVEKTVFIRSKQLLNVLNFEFKNLFSIDLTNWPLHVVSYMILAQKHFLMSLNCSLSLSLLT